MLVEHTTWSNRKKKTKPKESVDSFFYLIVPGWWIASGLKKSEIGTHVFLKIEILKVKNASWSKKKMTSQKKKKYIFKSKYQNKKRYIWFLKYQTSNVFFVQLFYKKKWCWKNEGYIFFKQVIDNQKAKMAFYTINNWWVFKIKRYILKKGKPNLQNQNCTFFPKWRQPFQKNIGTFILKKEWLDEKRREHFSSIEHRRQMDISKKGRLLVAEVAKLKTSFSKSKDKHL